MWMRMNKWNMISTAKNIKSEKGDKYLVMNKNGYKWQIFRDGCSSNS